MGSKNGASTTSTGISDIISAASNADCPTVNVGAGNIVEFSMAGVMKLRFQIQSWGMNVWIDLKGEAYQVTDSCDKSLFTSFPEDDCDKVEVVDIENQEIECNADLEKEALDVCQACPNVVSVKDCVFEVCVLGDISAAHSLLEACDLSQPLDVEECGSPGKIKKSGAKKTEQTTCQHFAQANCQVRLRMCRSLSKCWRYRVPVQGKEGQVLLLPER